MLWLWRRLVATALIRPICRGSGPRKGKKIKKIIIIIINKKIKIKNINSLINTQIS